MASRISASTFAAPCQNAMTKVTPAGAIQSPLLVQVLEAQPRQPQTPATPQEFVAQGGLSSFEIAPDLLYLDFNRPLQAPEEFRRMAYDPQRIISHSSGVSGASSMHHPWELSRMTYHY